ncbi:NUDIX hydrolase [Acinetobacter sp. MD2]|uniref:NUDIX hydrolase n=1 Tax=Acinetobacter sp. MD2 TaxID=2600066 RepID=UPI002D1EC341|nr:NUDIX domain-containing protein [Acinetobacter sp. MD2]MEB3767165.1 NUDIX domain-containing protein [Acinetobacter sp. MD2]
MIPVRSIAVSGVALAKIGHETKILLMKRAKEGFWSHITGKVEAQETAQQTIVRECFEETAIVVTQMYSADYIEQFYEPNNNNIELVPVFVVFCQEDQIVTLNHEHTEYRWCTLEEAKTLVSFSGQRKLYDHVWKNFIDRQPFELLKITLDA